MEYKKCKVAGHVEYTGEQCPKCCKHKGQIYFEHGPRCYDCDALLAWMQAGQLEKMEREAAELKEHGGLLCERHWEIWFKDRSLIKKPASGCVACTVIQQDQDLRANLTAAEERIGLLRDQIEGEEIDHDKAILKLQAKLTALDVKCPACHHLMRFHDPHQDDTHACIQCAHKASQTRAAAAEESKRPMREALARLDNVVRLGIANGSIHLKDFPNDELSVSLSSARAVLKGRDVEPDKQERK